MNLTTVFYFVCLTVSSFLYSFHGTFVSPLVHTSIPKNAYGNIKLEPQIRINTQNLHKGLATQGIYFLAVYHKWNAQDFATYFDVQLQTGGVSEQQLLKSYHLYKLPAFVAYLKTVSDFEGHVLSLHKKIHCGCKKHLKQVCKETGLREKELHELICLHAQEILEQQKKQEQQKKERAILSSFRPVQQDIIGALETSKSVIQFTDRLDDIAEEVLLQANEKNLAVSEVASQVFRTIDHISDAQDPIESAFHVLIVDRVLGDVQDSAASQALGKQTTLQRAPKLLMQAINTFISGLSPVHQVKQISQFVAQTAHFVADVTLGKLYLPEHHYKERIDSFWRCVEALSYENFSKLEAEQWVDLVANIAADCVFGMGVCKAISYLKEIQGVTAAQQKAREVAGRLWQAADKSLAQKPLVVTAEGASFRAMDKMSEVGSAAQEVIRNGADVLKSVHADYILQVEKEIEQLEQMFNFTRKGFGEFSNKYIKVDCRHILGMDLRFSRRGVPQIGGFHHDYLQAIEKSGVFEFANKVVYESGFYKATLLYQGNKVKDVSFFPAHWSRKKVIHAVYEAYDDFTEMGLLAELKSNGSHYVKASTKNKVAIDIFITNNGLISTAYPKM